MPLVVGRAQVQGQGECPVARQKFALNTEPHVAEIGDNIILEFRPEVMGDEFLEAWEALQETYRTLGVDQASVSNSSAETLKTAGTAVRRFLAGFMLPESAKLYAWWEVRDKAGKVVFDSGDPEEAAAQAKTVKGTTVVDVGLRLPDRVHLELMSWITEVYGQRPTTSSSGSAAPLPPHGTKSTASSRSKASTPARGRSRAS
ncbi:hypothetical protein [Nonomuraea turcica]|uniref:hypothetical protein n=1 Tax=Nonomuraea sp. G32 TaxID=3067274 RepID=UPI00273B2C96|nr:hypothetical protein [Nonomuraea sp. G32]MDP4512054.1 hypothetical protein [Nonomuraea sp. G32]